MSVEQEKLNMQDIADELRHLKKFCFSSISGKPGC